MLIPTFYRLSTHSKPDSTSVYWDGQPQNLTPEEENHLPDDAALDADGAPNYLTGAYTICLSLPSDEEQALVAQSHLDFKTPLCANSLNWKMPTWGLCCHRAWP